MLTPRKDDPNFVDEKLRRAADPKSFGASHEEKVKQAVKEKQIAEGVDEAKADETKKAEEAKADESKSASKK